MKKIKAVIKLNLPAGKANPAPPVGPALGQHGVAIMEFCKAFNEKTKDLGDDIIPAIITVYEDRSFDFITKTPPTSSLLLRAAGIEKGSGATGRDKVGKVTKSQVREIAERKMPDLNAKTIDEAEKIVGGTAKSMGIEIES